MSRWMTAKDYYNEKPMKSYYADKENQELYSASVNKSRNEAVLVEKMADKFTISIVKMRNPMCVLYELRENGTVVAYDDIQTAKDEAQNWIDNHPNGLQKKDKSDLLNPK